MKHNEQGVNFHINSILEEAERVEEVLQEHGFLDNQKLSKKEILDISLQCLKLWMINERNVEIIRIADVLEKFEQKEFKED